MKVHLALAAVALAGPALAQFNVDVGDPFSTFGVPANTYAAAGSAGVWNAYDPAIPGPAPLMDQSGSPTSVTLSHTGSLVQYFFDNVNTTGDDAALLDDCSDLGSSLTTITSYTFAGLGSGTYDVLVYAWAPDSRTTYITSVTVQGGGLGAQACGGQDWTGAHVLGATYVMDTVTVAAGGSIVIDVVNQAGFGTLNGFQIEPSGCGPVNLYCTAKVNSLGCTPAVGVSGTPSATNAGPFVVSASLVLNNRPGLGFYKVNGAQAANPFQCGTLCVGPSGIKRTPVSSAGGNPAPAVDCSGKYSIDMNAFAVGLGGGNPDPGLQIMGNNYQMQFWSRDQGFSPPCNTGLTDAADVTAICN